MYRKLLLVALSFCLYGCVHPQKYDRPAMPVPDTWPQNAAGASGGTAAPAAVDVKWRDYFADTGLQSVIELALANNRDLRMAALNVEQVEAMYQIQRAKQLPTVSASANGDLYRMPGRLSSDGEPYTYSVYQVGVGTSSWELDLFGRIRSLKQEAWEQYLATGEARTATQIALVASVANSYLALAADRDNLRLAQSTLEAQQSTLDLIQRRRDVGISSDLEVRQAQSQVDAARVDIARYTGQVTLDENALNLLVGTPVPANLLPTQPVSEQGLKDIAAGLPSEVLLQRPDILSAEHQLMAAYANIGVARAAFFPQITLTAAAGFMSGHLSDLFKYGDRTWNFAPQIGLPIFDRGARKANLKVAQVERDYLIAQYEKAIQSAFREVNDSLSQRRRLVEQEDAQQALVKTLQDTYNLADVRYKAGTDSYLTVLDAQRSLYAAQQVLVNLQFARLSNLVTLYKVLGGGA